ncbi:hypothetical protein [Salicola sp. Rm-C-2C1-2]|uniref:hypothetical protein n=1 Tax=Salicola sp. Rm-C-2C1-2 TaxID=3141321 RepID=UPI0032E446A0
MSASNNSRNRRSARSTFALPFWIALASLVGLVTALLGDGLWNAVAWLGLGTPIVALGYGLIYRTG